MKNYNLIIMPLYILSIMFSISSNAWLTMWIGMEMNLLTFIFILLEEKSLNSIECTMKYFLIQSAGSTLFLFSMGSHMIFYNEMFMISAILTPIALILKSGMAPLHTWTPPIVMKFNPKSLFLFLSMQKITPVIILFSSWSTMFKWVIFVNIIIGSIGGVTQSSFQKMMVYSSINNSGWMMMSISESLFLFMLFFITYLFMTKMLLNFMEQNKIKWMIQINSCGMEAKIHYVSMMISMSGLPPFIGFLPKWMIVKKTILVMPLLTYTSVVMSFFTLYFYMKSCISMCLTSECSKKWKINLINSHSGSLLTISNLMILPMFFSLT
uniref:NADH-ubiquinone oxidoreductase chain 2 n=1 Tax=Acizzia uncatoides TaxID=121830 RepID=A0A344A218_ACIUN|nr:NADH dehydrogenase subunit 2 [Acizzia uncatoides]AWU48809.1 NADH dehydrogenase subunit 2 [Acizzia uncatoides]